MLSPPNPSKDKISLHHRAYHTALKDQSQIRLSSLVNSYTQIQPILHPHVANPNKIDSDALIYTLQRLPVEIDYSLEVIMAQMPENFSQAGYPGIESWHPVSAPSRRRRSFWDGKKTTAFFISSVSGLDDLVNLLLAYQIEWNKLHTLLKKHCSHSRDIFTFLSNPQNQEKLGLAPEIWPRLLTALGSRPKQRLHLIFRQSKNIKLKLLSGSWVDYTRSVQKWWKSLAKRTPKNLGISHLEIYFISSNLHSISNLLSPFVWQNKDKILNHLKKNYLPHWRRWRESHHLATSPRDFLYFASKFYFTDHPGEFQKKLRHDARHGVLFYPAQHYLDVNVQLIPVSHLSHPRLIDPRLTVKKPAKLKKSRRYLMNIDYPLGFAAYHMFNEVLENVAAVKGLYILGKAAVLNSEVGDLQIPRIVFDEHSQNSYIFKNCFNQFFPYELKMGSLLTQQKAISVLGTFLENQDLLDSLSSQDFTVIEMENGPYLSAVTEATHPTRFPTNTIVTLEDPPMDLGIINYTSDTPYSKAKNLGSHTLQLEGIEPVYTASLAILQRIIKQEEKS